MKKVIILLIAVVLLWNFQNSVTFDDQTSLSSLEQEESSSKNSFESEGLELVCYSNKEIALLKYFSQNIDYKNQLMPVGFDLSVATPPPNFL